MSTLAVVLPVGPGIEQAFLRDTLDSISSFVPDHRLIVLDDSRDELVAGTVAADATVIPIGEARQGRKGSMYRSLSVGFREALNRPFDVLLRIDTDALLLGGSFVERAAQLFAANPRLGALGAYRTDYDGSRRGYGAPAYRIRLMLTTEAASDPRRTLRVAGLLARAYTRGGYTRGQFVLGGATLYSPNVIRALERAKLLDDPPLGRSGMAEDHIFGLCMSALGFEMRDFGTAADDGPFGATWRGLPAPPEELLAAGKEIIHSTKSYGAQEESAVREIFRRARQIHA